MYTRRQKDDWYDVELFIYLTPMVVDLVPFPSAM